MVFKAFRNETFQAIPQEMEEALICDLLNLSYTDLQKQPEDWIQKRLIILEAKGKLEKTKLNQSQSKLPQG